MLCQVFDYGNIVRHGKGSLFTAMLDIAIVLGYLKQADYARATLRHAGVIKSAGLHSPISPLFQDFGALNEEVGEELLSGVARTIVGVSSRADIKLVEENMLNVVSVSSLLEATDSPSAILFDRRSTRHVFDYDSPGTLTASAFWTKTVNSLEDGTYGLYNSLCYLSADEARVNLDYDTPSKDFDSPLPYLRKLMDTEIAKKAYTGNWLGGFRAQLEVHVSDYIYPAPGRDEVVEEEAQSDEDIDEREGTPPPALMGSRRRRRAVSNSPSSASADGDRGDSARSSPTSSPPLSPLSSNQLAPEPPREDILDPFVPSPLRQVFDTYEDTWASQPMPAVRTRRPSRKALLAANAHHED